MNMKNTTLLAGIVLVVFLVSQCSCGRSYGMLVTVYCLFVIVICLSGLRFR